MKERIEIKQQAKQSFHLNYGICIGAFILFVLIGNPFEMFKDIYEFFASIGELGFTDVWVNAFAIGNMDIQTGMSLALDIFDNVALYLRDQFNIGVLLNYIPLLFSIFLLPPLLVGYSGFSLKVYTDKKTAIKEMFSIGFDNYWRKVGGILWMQLFIFLWSLLFIIPGTIKSFAYFMTPYILADSKNVSATEALKLSMRMTKGYKGEIFVMQLSFIGWQLLSALTFGLLGVLYVSPYYYTSLAGMYEELKQNAIESGVVLAEELA